MSLINYLNDPSVNGEEKAIRIEINQSEYYEHIEDFSIRPISIEQAKLILDVMRCSDLEYIQQDKIPMADADDEGCLTIFYKEHRDHLYLPYMALMQLNGYEDTYYFIDAKKEILKKRHGV